MAGTTSLYTQLFNPLCQYSTFRDLRHLKALAWMVTALVCSHQLTLSAWEAYVPSRATQAQSVERRWQRFLKMCQAISWSTNGMTLFVIRTD